MKRSAQVTAPLLAAAALMVLSGCRKQPEMQRCVDENNKVVDPTLCKNIPLQSQPGQNGYGNGYNHGGVVFFPYHYYYGGGGGYGLGSSVYGGSTTAISGHTYSSTSGRASSTSRGGFGSSFGGSSSSGSSGGE